MDERLSAIQDAFSDYADKKVQAVCCAIVNEQGEIETLFYGNASQQTLLSSVLVAHIQSALMQMSSIGEVRT